MSIAADAVYAVLDERTRLLLESRAHGIAAHRRGWLVRRALLIADLIGLTLAFTLAHVLYPDAQGTLNGAGEIVVFVASLPLWVVGAKLYGLYDKDEERTDHSTTDDFAGVFHLVTVCTFLLYAISLQTRWFNPQFDKLLFFWALACISVTAGRAVARAYCRRQVNYVQNTIIVGAGDVGQNVARKLLSHAEYGLNLVGFVDSSPKAIGADLSHVAVLGNLPDLPQLVSLLDVERVIVAFSNDSHQQLLDFVRSVTDLDVQVDIVPRLFESLSPSAITHSMEGIVLLGLPPLRLTRSSQLLKRALDLGLAALTLVIAAPILFTAAIAIKLESPGPVLYRHRRVGRDGRPIEVLKFRTMYRQYCRGDRYGGSDAEQMLRELLRDPSRGREFEETQKLQSDPRVSRVGSFLRRTSIDELPQLANVLRGQLSLVGPRAITEEELDRYGADAPTLLSIRPGITGYWQINGRSRLSYTDRVRLDLAYIAGWSLRLDIAILARTFGVLARRQGAY